MNPNHGDLIEQKIVSKLFTFNEKPTTSTNIVIFAINPISTESTTSSIATASANLDESSNSLGMTTENKVQGVQMIHYYIPNLGMITHYIGEWDR